MSATTKQAKQTSAAVVADSKRTSKKEPVPEPVDDEVEDVEEAEEAEDVEEVEEAEAEAEDDAEEETTGKKKNKQKVEFNCESVEEALAELIRVDSELDHQMKYRKAVFKTYQKIVTRQLKQSKKRRAHASDTPKEATGFVKAISVPLKFKAFFESHLKNDEEFKKVFTSFDINKDAPRTDITKMIWHYIRTNELYGKKEDGTTDKRTITPDDELRDLLSVGEDETVGFSNFQSFVSRLYSSNNVVEASDEVEDEAEEAVEEVVEAVVAKSKGAKKQVAAVKA
jgi:chromatin remodeling complex protein RSC6